MGDLAITVWFSIYGLLLAYWQLAESLASGTQYASPYLPCAWVAWLLGAPVFAVIEPRIIARREDDDRG